MQKKPSSKSSINVRNGRKGGILTRARIQFARSAEEAGVDITKPFRIAAVSQRRKLLSA